jgi:hypothetical protein
VALASEDFKTAAVALASLASVTTDEIDKFLPNCDCPFLRTFTAYNIAKRLIELGRHNEALKLLEVALAEAKREDPRHDATPHFVQEVEKLYKEAALETLL